MTARTVDVLKPCPFCGGEAVHAPSFSDMGEAPRERVRCRQCGVQIVDYTRSASSALNVTKRWNTRAIALAEQEQAP